MHACSREDPPPLNGTISKIQVIGKVTSILQVGGFAWLNIINVWLVGALVPCQLVARRGYRQLCLVAIGGFACMVSLDRSFHRKLLEFCFNGKSVKPSSVDALKVPTSESGPYLKTVASRHFFTCRDADWYLKI